MEKDVLVILMIAFGLFAIVMFILFFVYLKKYYNRRHIDDDYKKEIDNRDDEDNDIEDSMEFEGDVDFVPVKKK